MLFNKGRKFHIVQVDFVKYKVLLEMPLPIQIDFTDKDF